MNTSLQHVLDSLQNKKNSRYLGFLAGALFIAVASYGAYYYYSQRKAQEAQKALSESLAEFDKAMQSNPKDARWDDVARTFQAAYDRYGSTWAGPYLLAYKAHALVQDDKFEEALTAMEKSVSTLPKASPLYYFYATKLALMKVDSKDATRQETGLRDLDTLAENIKNPERETALYYAGYHAAQQGDSKKAHALWTTLVHKGEPNSMWVTKAKKKLEFLPMTSIKQAA